MLNECMLGMAKDGMGILNESLYYKWHCPPSTSNSHKKILPSVRDSLPLKIVLPLFRSPRGFPVPETFKLDHLQPVKPLLFQNLSNFFFFILGGHFFIPQRANNGKRGFSQLEKWMRQMALSAWGIQTGPFAACWATFVLIFFQLFHFYTGEPILYTPEGQ